MKKYFNIILTIAILLCFTGCNKQLENAKSKEALATEVGTYMTNLSEAVKDTKKEQNKNTFSFVFCTDLHYSLQKGCNGPQGLKTIKAINNIIENCSINFAEMNGDSLYNMEESNDTILKDMNTIKKTIYRRSKFFFVNGNHDLGSRIVNGNTVTDNTLSKKVRSLFITGDTRKITVRDETNPDSMYYYYDIPNSNVRAVFLDSCDINYEGIQTNIDMNQKYIYSLAQVNWVKNVALNTKKQVIIFTHVGMIPYFKNFDGPIVNGDQMYRNIINFKKAGGIVIAIMTGHYHYDESFIDNGINHIASTCAQCQSYENQYKRMPNTVTEQAFDIVTVDTSARKIYMNRVGAGSNRTFNY